MQGGKQQMKGENETRKEERQMLSERDKIRGRQHLDQQWRHHQH